MRRLIASLWVVVALLAASDARADDGRDATALREDFEAYFAGERWAGLYAGGAGILFAGAGIGLVRKGNTFFRGAGWGLVVLGALQAVGGIGYRVVLSKTVPAHEGELDRDPATFHTAELARMGGVVTRFNPIRRQDVVLAVIGAGVAAFGLASRRATWQGVGVSISLQALALLALEEVDYRRALRYQEQLVHLAGTGLERVFEAR